MEENTNKKESLVSMLVSIPGFWKKQHSDWKITVVRTLLERLGYQMIYPYLSLYIIALGADKTQLGLITSLGMILAAIIGPTTGQMIDRKGPKKIYIFGIAVLFLSYLIYAMAPTWVLCVVAMILYYLGQGISGQSCATICGTCLKNCDRARGMLVCESLAAGLLGMIGPLMASFILVNIIGAPEQGAGAEHYRYLFYVSAFFTALSMVVVVAKLSKDKMSVKKRTFALKEGFELLKHNKNTRKWIVIGAIGGMPNAMILPYWQVFADKIKGANVTTLAAMVTISAVTSVILGYPVGALADRFGRKKVLFVLIPLFWLSMLLMMVTPVSASWMMLIASFFYGFYHITSPLTGAVQRELVSNDVMGTWIGVNKLVTNLVSALMAIIAGLIYDYIGPQWVFIIFIAIDAFIRVPLIASLPETLDGKALKQ